MSRYLETFQHKTRLTFTLSFCVCATDAWVNPEHTMLPFVCVSRRLSRENRRLIESDIICHTCLYLVSIGILSTLLKISLFYTTHYFGLQVFNSFNLWISLVFSLFHGTIFYHYFINNLWEACLNLCLWLCTDIILLNLSFKYLKVTTSDLIMQYDHSTYLEVEVMDILTNIQICTYAVCVFICSKIVPVIKLNMKVAKSKVLMHLYMVCVKTTYMYKFYKFFHVTCWCLGSVMKDLSIKKNHTSTG